MSTAFPSATEYLKRGGLPKVGDATIGVQPSHQPPIDFGKQPEGFRNKDIDAVSGKRRRILVVGGGDVWNKFARAALEHRGAELFMYDPELLKGTPEEQAQKLAKAGIDAAHCVGADASGKFPQVPPDTNTVVVLTPPEYHAGYIRWAQQQKLPAIVEKPLVADVKDFQELDGLLAHATAPVYCMDWKAAHVLPLAAVIGHAMDEQVPYDDAVRIEGPASQALKQFDFQHIASITGSFVEKADGFGSMDYVKEHRPLIYAQGVLKDMGVHPMAALANMGFEPGEVRSAVLGDTEGQKEAGVYRRVGNGESTAAWYGKAEMVSHFHGQHIPTVIEAAKAGSVAQDFVSLTDRNGHVLHWEYGDHASHVTLEVNGKTIPIATANIDPYALMFDQALHFFETQKQQPHKSALYYHEQKAILGAVNAMERIGRQGPVAATDQVRQLALEPAPQVDLSKATIKEPTPEPALPL